MDFAFKQEMGTSMLQKFHGFLEHTPFYEVENIKDKDLNNDNGQDQGLLNHLFDRNTVMFISNLRIPNVEIQDKIMQVPNKIGQLSIKSTYNMMLKEKNNGQVQFQKKFGK